MARAAERARASRRHFSSLTRRDKVVLWIIVGVPTAIHIVFVWIPAISHDRAVVHQLGRHRRRRRHPLRRLPELLGDLHDLRQATSSRRCSTTASCVVWLFLVPTAIGCCSPTCSTRTCAAAHLPEHLLLPGRAVARRRRVHLEERDVLAEPGAVLNILGRAAGEPDRLRRRPEVFQLDIPFLDTPLGLSQELRRASSSPSPGGTSGYIMVLYLAGLKSVDPALREAAAIDGCTEWQAFRRVVFPAMKPINVVVAVITVIEALRAYDIVVRPQVDREGWRCWRSSSPTT